MGGGDLSEDGHNRLDITNFCLCQACCKLFRASCAGRVEGCLLEDDYIQLTRKYWIALVGGWPESTTYYTYIHRICLT